MFKACRPWIYLFVCVISTNVVAQGRDLPAQQMQGAAEQEAFQSGFEMAPPPPGPFWLEPGWESANIDDMQIPTPYQQYMDPYQAHPGGQPHPGAQQYYPSPTQAPRGYAPQYAEPYRDAHPPYRQSPYDSSYGSQR